MKVQLAMFGVWELVIILVIVLLIFGAGKLPMLGEGLGKGIRNFRKSFKDDPKEVDGQAKRLDEGEQPQQLPGAQVEDPVQIEKEKIEKPRD